MQADLRSPPIAWPLIVAGLLIVFGAGIVSVGSDSTAALPGADALCWALCWALWLTPAMLAGIWGGQRSFTGIAPVKFRRHVLNLLIVIAGISVLRALAALPG